METKDVFDAERIEQATIAIRRGGLVIAPTETFYGLMADPRLAAAVDAVFATKNRPGGRALPLVACCAPQVALAAPGWDRSLVARKLAEHFWPGPLSLVVTGSERLCAAVKAADGTTAIRVSSHPLAKMLAERVGFPLIATSANRSGRPPACRAEQARAGLGDLPEVEMVVVLDGGETAGGAPSTIVDTRGDEPRIVREGAISASAIRAALAESGR
ncbi:MAG: threonylcarbamoyl-AMP synthase [Acidobacteriota bacterium]|nr:MAG: threonylcarbamoyl-AMP synthase [Acidobacteriota bacterium]